MCQNKFEYLLLEMHDKFNNNFEFGASCSSRHQQLFVDTLAIQWPPFNTVTIYGPLGWPNWPLGVKIDHFENHCCRPCMFLLIISKSDHLVQKWEKSTQNLHTAAEHHCLEKQKKKSIVKNVVIFWLFFVESVLQQANVNKTSKN